MEVQIRVSGGDEIEEVSSLWTWLRGERGLAGAVRVVRPAPAETELGGAFDMLAVAVGAGGAGTVLAQSLTAWMRTRRANVEVNVTTGTRTVTVKASDLNPDIVVPLLRQILSDKDD